MIKTFLNIFIFLTSIIIPLSIVIIIANIYRLDVLPFGPMFVSLITLFGLEVAMSLSGKMYIRKYLHGFKEKIFFIIATTGFWVLAVFIVKVIMALKDS